MKTPILVTGGAGYIGSQTVDALIQSGFDVVIVDDLSTGFRELLHPKARFFQMSLNETEKLAEIMSHEKIAGVIHFAAKIVAPESIEQSLSYYENNTQGVISTLKACKKAKVSNFVFSSTAAVYGDNKNEMVDEKSPTIPLNPYGHSKLFSEQIIKDSEVEFGIRSVIFRYFNVAGADLLGRYGQRSNQLSHLIKLASEAACGKREKLLITGTDYPTKDGTGIRDYIHVEDLADAHVLAMKYLLSGGTSDLFNCGYGEGYSVKEVIECMKKVSGKDFLVENAPRRTGDIVKIIADSTKLKTKLNWKPSKNDLAIICKSAYEFEKSL